MIKISKSAEEFQKCFKQKLEETQKGKIKGNIDWLIEEAVNCLPKRGSGFTLSDFREKLIEIKNNLCTNKDAYSELFKDGLSVKGKTEPVKSNNYFGQCKLENNKIVSNDGKAPPYSLHKTSIAIYRKLKEKGMLKKDVQ